MMSCSVSCRGVVLGSDTAPVREMIRDGENGLMADFFSPDALLGLTQDAELDHSQFGRECGYAPLSLEEGFARTFGGTTTRAPSP